MVNKKGSRDGTVVYSEAFKMEVVRELEQEDLSYREVAIKYGIQGSETIQRWVRRYGNGSRGKVIRVEKPQEKEELKRLRDRVKRLESALADANIDLSLERAYLQEACKRAGIEDVEKFKKKSDGSPRTKR